MEPWDTWRTRLAALSLRPSLLDLAPTVELTDVNGRADSMSPCPSWTEFLLEGRPPPVLPPPRELRDEVELRREREDGP